MKLGIAGTPLPDYESMTDEEIVEIARVGDIDAQEYLINKYKNYVRAKARTYFWLGGDKEDLIQEGMIGMYKAIRDFRSDKLSSFRAGHLQTATVVHEMLVYLGICGP